MGLFLAEIEPATDARTAEGVSGLLDRLSAAVQSQDGAQGAAAIEVIEAQVTADRGRVFVILEAEGAEALDALLAAVHPGTEPVTPVRLVGDDLERVKATRSAAGYLVEWDLPEGLTMEAYLTRKKEKSPLYAQVPETAFLRTYVREDMVKCLCFYDAPDEEAVVRAREVVSAPVDRLHRLASS